ncbi:MAG: hypothetical protein WCH34_08220 [Bacteroidota bacterium]
MELKDEAQVLTKYLIGENTTSEVVDLYTLAIGCLNISFTKNEQNQWDKMMKNVFLLKVIDSGLAIIDKNNPIRKRIFLMLAILEAQPNYYNHFFQKERNSWYLLNFFYRGMVSVFYLVIGVLYLIFFKI